MRSRARLVLGTRGSDLARAQTQVVENALREAFPQTEIEIRVLRTRGDEGVEAFDRHAGRKGLFTSEIERALLEDEIDLAVHSAKDLPSEKTSGTILGALPRGPVEDILVTAERGGLLELSHGARIATGSVRRQRQVRWKRPDLELEELRGNVPTRLRKLVASDSWAGIILAQAGLQRLGLFSGNGSFSFEGRELFTTVLNADEFVPAGGQGIIALQIRENDAAAHEAVNVIGNLDAVHALRVEREFLRLLQGDCRTPVGVLARTSQDQLAAHAQLFPDEQPEPLLASATGKREEPEALAGRLMEQLHAGKTRTR
jgi:hydroxymethylbilane synthase